MNNLFGYIRVSTVKQGEHGVSLVEQRAAIERFAQGSGVSICRWFEEQETAAKRGRPVFGQMIRLLRQGAASGVVMHKIDRSARNLKDWADLGELIDAGVRVHFANEALDLNSRGGRLSADIQAVVASDYIRNLRDETKKGIYGRFKQGLYPRPAPLGYLDQGSGKAKIPDPVRGPLIRKAFELYSSGLYSLDGLAAELYSLGLRTLDGKRLWVSMLSRILNNPFYTGLIRVATTGETYQGVHESLVSMALFERVQRLLRAKITKPVFKHRFLFRQLLECGHCGRSLVGEQQKGHTYYRCHARLRRSREMTLLCSEKVIQHHLLEDAAFGSTRKDHAPVQTLVRARFGERDRIALFAIR